MSAREYVDRKNAIYEHLANFKPAKDSPEVPFVYLGEPQKLLLQGKTTGKKIPMSIKEQREVILTELQWKRREFDDFVKKTTARIQSLQLQCPHENQTWEPDPSGNNDSAYCCPDCGKQSKRKL